MAKRKSFKEIMEAGDNGNDFSKILSATTSLYDDEETKKSTKSTTTTKSSTSKSSSSSYTRHKFSEVKAFSPLSEKDVNNYFTSANTLYSEMYNNYNSDDLIGTGKKYSSYADSVKKYQDQVNSIKSYYNANRDSLGEDKYNEGIKGLETLTNNIDEILNSYKSASTVKQEDIDALEAYKAKQAEYERLLNLDLEEQQKLIDEEENRIAANGRGSETFNNYSAQLIEIDKKRLSPDISDEEYAALSDEYDRICELRSGESDQEKLNQLKSDYELANRYQYGKTSQEFVDSLPDDVRELMSSYYNLKNSGAIGTNSISVMEEIKNKTGWDTAAFEEAYDKFEWVNDEKYQKERTEYFQEYAAEHPNLATALSVGTNLLSGIGQLDMATQQAANEMNGSNRPINLNSQGMTALNTTEDIRNQVISDLVSGNTKVFGQDVSGLYMPEFLGGQNVGEFGYSTLTSMIDSAANMIVSTALTGGMGLTGEAAKHAVSGTMSLIMGSQVAATESKRLIESGAPAEEALTMGAIYGAIEGISETFSVESIIDAIGSDKKVWQKLIKSFLAEGGEEVESNWLGRLVEITDYEISGRESEFVATYNAYRQNGESDIVALGKAFRDFLPEDASAFLAGGLSGLAMGGTYGAYSGANAVLNGAANAKSNYQSGKNVLQNQSYGTVAENAKEILPENSRLAKLAAEVSGLSEEQIAKQNKVQKAITQYKVGKLANKSVKALEGKSAEITRSEIENQLVSRGVSEKAAKQYSKILVRQADSGEFNVPNNTAEADMKAVEAVVSDLRGENDKNAEWVQSLNEKLSAVTKNAVNIVNDTAPQFAQNEVVESQRKESTKIAEVDHVENGTVYVRTDDGVTSVANLSLNSGETGIVYEAAAEMSSEEARLFTSVYTPDTDASTYVQAWNSVKRFAELGLSYANAVQSSVVDGLTPAQVKAAYSFGRNIREKRISERQEALSKDKIKSMEKGSVQVRKGKVTKEFEGITLSKKQRSAIWVATKISEYTGIDVNLFASDYTGMNGKYIDGKLWLDINSGNIGEQAILRTMAHELTHFTQQFSPKQYEEFKEFLFSELNKYDSDTVHQLMLDQIANAKKSGVELSEEAALDEVVADACEMMLKDGSALKKLAQSKLSTKHKIIAKIKDLINAIAKAFEGVRPNSAEYAKLQEVKADFEKLQQMWNEAFADAAETYNAAVGTNTDDKFSKAVNQNGESVFSLRTMDEDKNAYRELLRGTNVISEKELNSLFKMIDNVSELIRENREILDFGWDMETAHRPFKPVKPNSDPLYKYSVDFSTICRKRLLQQIVSERLSAVQKKAVTKEQGIAIRRALEQLRKEGLKIEVACALCYVESARMKSPAQVQRFLDDRTSVLTNYFANKNKAFMTSVNAETSQLAVSLGYESDTPLKKMSGADRNTVRALKRKLIKEYVPTAKEQEIINRANEMPITNFTTSQGLAKLSNTEVDIFGAFTSFVRNATKSKGIEADVPFAFGDTSEISDETIASMNRENGLRMQSWSDFQVIHTLDYIAAVIELSARGAKIQTYTKVPDFVKLMGRTGTMINLSLIPKAKFNGSLEFDSYEGIDFETAKKLRKEYATTAGTIAIGINDDQIRLLLESDLIDYVIPYHSSGMSAATRRQMNIPGWKSYQNVQNESKKDYSNTVHDDEYQKKPMFSEWFDLDQAKKIAAKNGANAAMRAMAEQYKELCHSRGLQEKFAAFSNEPNYWKLLIDRKMIDQTTDSIIEQQAVKPIFEEQAIREILKDEVARFKEVNRDMEIAADIVLDIAKNGKLDIAGAKEEIKHSKQWAIAKGITEAYAQQGKEKIEEQEQYSLRSNTESPREILARVFSSQAPEYKAYATALKGYQDTVAKLDRANARMKELQNKESKLRTVKYGTALEKNVYLKNANDRIRFLKQNAESQRIVRENIERYESILSDYETRTLKKVIEAEQAKEIAEVRAAGRQRLDEYRSNKKRKELVGIITKRATKLSDMLLTNSDKKHIPEPLKQPLGEFLSALNLSSEQRLKTGKATQKDVRYDNMVANIKDAVDKIQKAQRGEDDGSVVDVSGYLDLPKDFSELLDGVSNQIKAWIPTGESDYVLNDMPVAALNDLNIALSILDRSISNANRLIANRLFKTAEEAGRSSDEYLSKMRDASAHTGAVTKFINWSNTLPYYAFKRFGEGGTAIFEELMDAGDKLAFNAKEILDFTEKTYTSAQVKEWTTHMNSFDIEGYQFKMTDAQIMSLYCLSKRKQAVQHLSAGGFRVADIKDKKSTVRQTNSIHLSEDGLAELFSNLSSKQVAVADKLQEFMSTTCANWGNSVSMQRFGIKSFTEENYFPIQSDKNNMNATDTEGSQSSDLFRLLNMSFAKSLNARANNAIVVGDIFDVFTDHSTDMAKYNAYGIAILDAMKWLNYREQYALSNGTIETKSLQRSLERAYGADAKQYIINLIKDINGSYEGGIKDADGIAKGMMSKYKVAAVAANFRVAMLQPTSYFRASAVLSSSSLAKALAATPKSVVKNIQLAEKHCGIALWKSFGFYDTNISRNLRSQIKNDQTVIDKTVEASMKGAEIGDKVTWGYLWRACEHETVKENKALKIGSDEYYKAVGKKLREVIYSTQVVDGVLTRSQMMRGKSAYTQMATAFMSEPTLSYNMLLDSYTEFHNLRRMGAKPAEAWAKSRKKIVRNISAYAITAIVAAVVEAFVDSYRDDDDKEFLDKLLENLKTNLLSDLNPISKIPFIKDAWTILVGNRVNDTDYTVDRMDMVSIEELSKCIDIWYSIITKGDESNYTVYGAIYKTMKSASQISGIPLSNTMREIASIWNATAGSANSNLKLLTYDAGTSNKEYIEKYDFAYKKNSSSAKAHIDELIEEKLSARKEEYPNESDADAKKAVRSSVRATVTNYYKERYLNAYMAKDNSEMLEIRKKMQNTGLYDSVADTCSNWIKAYAEELKKKGE